MGRVLRLKVKINRRRGFVNKYLIFDSANYQTPEVKINIKTQFLIRKNPPT